MQIIPILPTRPDFQYLIKPRLLLCNSLIRSGDNIILNKTTYKTVFCISVKFQFIIRNKQLIICFGTLELITKPVILRFLNLVGFSTLDSFLIHGLTNYTYVGASVEKTLTLISFVQMNDLRKLLEL